MKKIGDRLRAVVRKPDTIARIGDDEFAILAANIESRDNADLLARKMQETIASPIVMDQQECCLSASIGVVFIPLTTDLLKHADNAMYKAKKNGHNNIRFFSDQAGGIVRD